MVGVRGLTQTLDVSHSVGWGGPGLVGDQSQFPEVLTSATACYLHLRIVCVVGLRLQTGKRAQNRIKGWKLQSASFSSPHEKHSAAEHTMENPAVARQKNKEDFYSLVDFNDVCGMALF